MIRDDRRCEEAGELDPAVAVRRAHHGNLDALIAQSSDTSGPFSFDRGPPFELEAELAKEINRPSEVIDDDSYVVHSFERHVSNLQAVVQSDNEPICYAEARASPPRWRFSGLLGLWMYIRCPRLGNVSSRGIDSMNELDRRSLLKLL